MTRGEVRELPDCVLDWPADDQAKFVRLVRELEQWQEDSGIIDEAREQLNERSLSPSR
jgi:hypothetical protein